MPYVRRGNVSTNTFLQILFVASIFSFLMTSRKRIRDTKTEEKRREQLGRKNNNNTRQNKKSCRIWRSNMSKRRDRASLGAMINWRNKLDKERRAAELEELHN